MSNVAPAAGDDSTTFTVSESPLFLAGYATPGNCCQADVTVTHCWAEPTVLVLPLGISFSLRHTVAPGRSLRTQPARVYAVPATIDFAGFEDV